ncbi:uncharacterized protein LOC123681669 [Harmonia axyridis]|uniref:uncharacterized protein LOC123681669 n=1 Tax=Harmonia axyridis TaxID=115357 RepID=UPI001E2785B3|nr:uncharacterized protein LOC123681669 [Harmonia axyridis]XP_045475863.1 uncharacterized protein LOC123681669 [Harmonia axyridis]
MSRCPRVQDCTAKRPQPKDTCPTPSTCRPNCPGGQKSCPDETECPSAKTPKPPDQCPVCTQTKSIVVKPPTCPAAAGCSQPIVIEAAEKCNKTDLRIELFIHQLPPEKGSAYRCSDGGRTGSRTAIDPNRTQSGVNANRTGGKAADGTIDGVIVEENIAVNKAGLLESAPPKPKGPGSDIGPDRNGRVNMATDTEEDGELGPSGGKYVDRSTQI